MRRQGVLGKTEMIFAVIIGFASAVVLFGSLFKYQEVSEALMDSFPSEFRKGTLWRTAFPVFALMPSTPLHLQLGYLQASAGFGFVILGVSLCCFLLDKEVAGWGVLAAFLVYSAMTIKSWRIYLSNRDRKLRGSREEEL
jgi:hypothetical protein